MNNKIIEIKNIVPFDPPFEDASFYNPGIVAEVSCDDRKVFVEVSGDLRLDNSETGSTVDDSGELRMKFSTGDLSLTSEHGWEWIDNRWFEFFLSKDGITECLECEICEDYTSAIDFATDILYDDDLWM